MLKKIKYRLVLIKWEDSSQPAPAWQFINDAPTLKIIKCLSVGWLIDSNKHVKMIAPNIGDIDNENAQASGFIQIPVRSIIKIVEINKPV